MFIIGGHLGRNCVLRKVGVVPIIKGFKPFGLLANPQKIVTLQMDEFEVVRLLDYLHMNQEEAASTMNISRPTLTRIYEKARKAIAQAFVEGLMIQIEENQNLQIPNQLHCHQCKTVYEETTNTPCCPKCQSDDVIVLKECFKHTCKECNKCNKKVSIQKKPRSEV